MIRKIDGVSVEGKSLQDCLGMIGGQAETKAGFEILNPERKQTTTVELTRQKFLTST
ncbi:MAG: hypothetical protein HY735_34645 [Verrucomicrobia bacterium]|nr:hypothetical protein [Verrucomicrobiota bacterium]